MGKIESIDEMNFEFHNNNTYSKLGGYVGKIRRLMELSLSIIRATLEMSIKGQLEKLVRLEI